MNMNDMIALQDLITETLNIFESEDIKQLERERMRLYMKVKNWKKSGKDTSELEKQLNDAKKRLSDAKKAARLAPKGAVVTPQQSTPSGDDSLFGDLGTDGFGSLDIDAMLRTDFDEEAQINAVKQFISENYSMVWMKVDTELIITKGKDKLLVRTRSGKTTVIVKNKKLKSLTNGMFEWESCGNFSCIQCEELESLEGAPKKCIDFLCNKCSRLKNLIGAPEKCKLFDCTSCKALESLEGAPKECDEFVCNYCYKITSFKHSPEICRRFNAEDTQTENLEGLSNQIEILVINGNDKITSLKGCPPKLKTLYCVSCYSLRSIEYLPKRRIKVIATGCPINNIIG